eukprot:CAMPEP_0184482858 /NCGR_PEP_ID=MMETSP0113_2-20130426/4452_1 /TAXON_ID=91329 /ORGANISM="Norrisiella sphaerica, Strain BC52" /LENGTH=219 /DNA_ID=CAMNT_0026862865 /DNA_START=803 /DNA_END=1459 /DNA_ORIENTATION=-
MVFEFGRCDRDYGYGNFSDAPQQNMLRFDAGFNLATQVSQVREYVATPAVCLALAGVSWALLVSLNCMVRVPRNTSIVLAFVLNYLFGLMFIICTGIVYNLYPREFDHSLVCYVQVVDQKFSDCISLLSMVWMGTVILHHCCMREDASFLHRLWFLAVTQLVVFVLLVLYTVKAWYAASKGLYAAAVFTIIGWQIITEVPTLAFLCKALFDLSEALVRH